MTSSLVGSEMCIRDRAGTRVHPCVLEPQRRLQERGGAGRQKPTGHSVSYTHLTLPTICSV
eukprot:10469166-Prorocentrum_lima.AAC.1